MSRFARFAANIRFNMYGQIAQAILPFFFIPFILRYLGQGAYSLYALIGVLTSQLNLLSFGAGPATVKYLAEFEAAGDTAKANSLINNSLVFYGAIGLLGVGIILALSPFFENRMLHIPNGLETAAHFIFLCAAGVFLLQSTARTFHAIPQALQRFDIWNGAETATTVFLYVGVYMLLTRGWWVRGLAAWSVATAAFNLLLYGVIGHRLIPDVSFRPAYEPAMMRKVAGFGGWLFASQVTWSVLYQMDKLVLGSFVPLSDLTYYLIAFNLSQKISLLLNPILPILLPFSSALHGQKDYDTARKLYLSGTKLTVILILPATVIAFFFSPAFLELWLGGHFSEHAGWVLRALLVGTFISTSTSFGNLITQGFGKVKTPTILWVSSVAVGVVFWFILIPAWGILGAAWVFAGIQTLYAGLFFFWCNGKLLGVSWKQFIGKLWRPLVVALPLIVVSILFRNSLKEWVPLGAFTGVAYAAYVGLCYLFALDNEERSRIWRINSPNAAF